MQPLSLSKEQVDSVIALYSSGKIQEAINAIKALNENYPNVPLLFNILGVCYETLGELDAASKMFKTAVTIKPDYAEAYFNLGVVQKGNEQPELSIESYRKAIAIKPNYPDAHNNLGNVFLDLNQYDNAVEHFEWAVAYKPDFAEAFNNLGVANREIDQFDNAVKNFKRAIELNPQYTQAHLNLGNIFKDLGQRDSAAKCFEKAIANEPDNAQAHVNLGTAFKEEGQIKDAIKSFKKAIKINPNYGVAYFNLINMKGNKVDQKLIAKMLSLLSSSNLNQSDRINLCFALAYSYEALDKKSEFFKFLHEGNRLRKEELNYSLEDSQETIDFVKKTFSSVALINKELPSYKPSKLRPIFIIGMPRSGSSLVEQIITSHSAVHGAGEIQYMRKILAPIVIKYIKNDPEFTPNLSGLKDSEIPKNKNSNNISNKDFLLIRKQYLEVLSRFNVSENIITDKALMNYRFIGFILKAFPEAKIIHLKRDARAICWSIYKNNFHQKGIGFGNNMEDLANYYSSYCEMMTFWHKMFPNKIYDLNYENLTTNQEEETRSLLEYCELGWDENCLNFHTNKRAVKTASVLQVRKKMYQGSSEAWKKYEKNLEPLIKSLNSL